MSRDIAPSIPYHNLYHHREELSQPAESPSPPASEDNMITHAHASSLTSSTVHPRMKSTEDTHLNTTRQTMVFMAVVVCNFCTGRGGYQR